MTSLGRALPLTGRFDTDAGLKAYLQQIQDFPLLEASEEQRLARLWTKNKDLDAAHALVTSHLRLAAKLARNYRGYGLPTAELVSEANIGLLQAVERFDPERGFRLATYAMWWIRAAIQEYILQSWSLVRLGTTAHQKKLFFNLRRLKGKIQAYEDGDLSDEAVGQIADALRVSKSEVVMMNRRMAGPDRSLNVPVKDESEMDWLDWLEDDSDSQETALAESEERRFRKARLSDALRTLSSRERDIIAERLLSDDRLTLEQLAHRYGISRERVRQIEVGALNKIQQVIKRDVARIETGIKGNREKHREQSLTTSTTQHESR